MNTTNLFKLGASKKFSALEITQTKSKELSIEFLNERLNEYTIHEGSTILVRAEKQNKISTVSTNIDNPNTPKQLIEDLEKTFKINDKKTTSKIYKGEKVYEQYFPYNNSLEKIDSKIKIENIKKIQKFIKNFDKRITNIRIQYFEKSTQEKIENNYGLKLNDKSNYYNYSVLLEGNDKGTTRTYYNSYLNNDHSIFDWKRFAKSSAEKFIKIFNPIKIQGGKYPVVINQENTAELIGALSIALSAEQVHKHISKFENKLGKQVCSKIVTLEEHPLNHDLYFTGYDEELVSKQNQTFIENGILKKYAYNLEYAFLHKTKSTGNGTVSGSRTSIGFDHLYLKPGEKKFEQMVGKIDKGIYVYDLTGFNASFDNISGNFSLKAKGFLIDKGKITKPISFMTISGNLFDLFNNIVDISNDIKIDASSIETASILVSNLTVTTD